MKLTKCFLQQVVGGIQTCCDVINIDYINIYFYEKTIV